MSKSKSKKKKNSQNFNFEEFFSVFSERLKNIYWEVITQEIIKNLKNRNVTVFRINILKSNKKEIEDFLNANNIEFQTSSFLNFCYIIDKKHEYFLKWSSIFYDGKIYIQWISSQIPAIILAPQKWEKILDMTAAPWWKTCQLASIMENTWEIVAIEKNQIRYNKMLYNINLQWVINTKTFKIDSNNIISNYEEEYFDKILIDAPCSAEWRINLEDEKTYGFWNIDNILKKQSIQIELIETGLKLLKKWWELIYSTCTLAPEENEEVIDIILNKYPECELVQINIEFEFTEKWITQFNDKKYLKDLEKTLRILPSSICEWFFIAKIKKN